jgi:hypothetical protein
MSHVVTLRTQLKDPAALAAACQRLALPAPVEGAARFYDGQTAAGLLVRLPGWRYPLVVDPATGEVRQDHFNGAWGEPRQLDRLLQVYAVEKIRREGHARGYRVTEQALSDGSVQIVLHEAG